MSRHPASGVGLLQEAFVAMDAWFAHADMDGLGTITATELLRSAISHGCTKTDELMQLFRNVDATKRGEIDYSAFLGFLFFWPEVGRYDLLFRSREAPAVQAAFDLIKREIAKQDKDHNSTINREELAGFLQSVAGGLPSNFDALCQSVFPAGRNELSCRRFLAFLYLLANPTGPYAHQLSNLDEHAQKLVHTHDPTHHGDSKLFSLIQRAFTALEADFRRFDANGDNGMDISELTMALPLHASTDHSRIDLMTRLNRIFKQVDADGSENIDFFEFLDFVYCLVQEGSYSQVIDQPAEAPLIKQAFLFLRNAYSQFDTDGNHRLSWDEFSGFLQKNFGTIDPAAQGLFRSLMTPGKEHIDFPRFLRILYHLVLPAGFYVNKAKGAAGPRKAPMVAPPKQTAPTHPPRVHGDINLGEVSNEKKLGEGSFGIVYLSSFRGYKVAAKYLKGNYTPQVQEEFLAEVNLMKTMDHPNLIFMVGACNQPPKLAIVMECCPSGSLFDLLHKQRQRLEPSFMYKVALDLAQGINAMHNLSPPIMHRDLKSLNVLLGPDYTGKVCDFGLSIAVNPSNTYDQGVGTPQWTAPEVLASPHYDLKSDVYSYAIILWEIAHREIPYPTMDQPTAARNVLRGLRPTIDPSVPAPFANLMRKCWETDPHRRPSMAEVVAELESPAFRSAMGVH